MEVREFFRQMGKKGESKASEIAAKKMIKTQQTARAKKAAVASAKVRNAEAKAKKADK